MLKDTVRGPAQRISIDSSIRRAATSWPTVDAARDLHGRALSFAALDTATSAQAEQLDALPGPACWVTATMPNRIDAMIAALAVLRGRHALVLLHPQLPEHTRAAVVARLRPIASLVVDDRDTGPRLVPGTDDPRPLWPAPRSLPDLQPVLGVLTSGTTGSPRVVLLPRVQVETACGEIAARLGYRAGDVVAAIPPVSFDFGLYQLLLAVRAGATVLLDERLGSPQGIATAIASAGATVLPVVPPALRALGRSRLLAATDTRAVRLITTTGDLLTEADVATAAVAFPAAEIVPMYGVSECKRIAMSPRGGRRPDGAVGRPLDTVDVAVGGPHSSRLGTGFAGELSVGGPLLALGYEDGIDDAARFAVDRRSGMRVLRTGDRLHQDEGGWLHWHGRSANLIKSSGHRVDAAEIERAGRDSGLLMEAAAYGRPDEARGQVPVLVGRIESGTDVETTRTAVLSALRGALPPWALPDVELRTAPLPRTANGKLDRTRLGSIAPVAAGPAPRVLIAPLGAVRPLPCPARLVHCHTQAMLSAFDIPFDVSPAEFELLTTLPFGVRAVPADPSRLLIPLVDPDVGLARACALLGLALETACWSLSEPETASERLRTWLETGPVVLGPLDLGELPYHPTASTLRGCDHYVVALGWDGDALVVRDPEGPPFTHLDPTALRGAWAAAAVPERRGSFMMRRLLLKPTAGDAEPSHLRGRLAGHIQANLLAAARHPSGGAHAYAALARLRLDPARRRGLALLIPSVAARCRFAARCCRRITGPSAPPGAGPIWERLGAAFDRQATGLARMHRAVSDGAVPDFASAAVREDEIGALAAQLPRAAAG